MATLSQTGRKFRVETALGPDALLLERFTGEESISTPYLFTLHMTSEDPAIDPEALLRKPATLAMELADGTERVVRGLIRRFVQLDGGGALTNYVAELVPPLWFLSLGSDCRIFQRQTVPEILGTIFDEHGITDYRFEVAGEVPEREYCVQYRESHLAFVSRLLEEEGIFYFFENDAERHVLVLADNPGAVQPCPGQASARMAGQAGPWQHEDVLTGLAIERVARTGKVTLTDYNYLTPTADLKAPMAGAEPEERYDYPGRYEQRERGERLARLQLEAHEAGRLTVRGEGTCRAFQPGYRFALKEHYRHDLNDREYQIVRVQHAGDSGGFGSGRGEDAVDYRGVVEAVPYDVPYRPPCLTPRPLVHGLQTAEVVGPGGEEIWTDQHGRVKVQFHWDRLGKKNEDSSCWVRVAQPWAGKGWGSLAIPRIGQEVVVEFLEGDPDRPLIVGSVYNADQAPPYSPKDGGVVSGLRSNTHKGSGYNEMSMNDTAGKEMITIHAQYDMSTTVEHDDTQRVVAGNRKIDVEAGTHTETIKGDTKITIVSGTYTLDVQAKTHTHHVKGDVTENYDASQTTTVAKIVKIDAGDEITLHTGSSTLTMKKDGKVTLHCKSLEIIGDVDIKASAPKVEVLGGDEAKLGVGNQQVTCDKMKVNVSGAAINSSAVGTHEITGALVKIN
jgi:type VI secretion system secreted protein VgrG